MEHLTKNHIQKHRQNISLCNNKTNRMSSMIRIHNRNLRVPCNLKPGEICEAFIRTIPARRNAVVMDDRKWEIFAQLLDLRQKRFFEEEFGF